jgi:hypothetical protein
MRYNPWEKGVFVSAGNMANVFLQSTAAVQNGCVLDTDKYMV